LPEAIVVPEDLLGLKRMNVSQIVKESFPGALPGPAIFRRVLTTLRKHGVQKGNTIYGQSICSDEINGDKGHVSALLTQHFGMVFPLGGIGGAPYVGKTGFGAFSHHVPDKGHVVILFGPHIGFTMDGEPGTFVRRGQAKPSTACGAVVAAYGQVTAGKLIPADVQDAQQAWLREKLKPHCAEVGKSEMPMVELVSRAYQAVEKEMLAIVNTDFGKGNLVLIGGIQINMPYPMNGFFQPLHFSVRSAGRKPRDLMSAFA